MTQAGHHSMFASDAKADYIKDGLVAEWLVEDNSGAANNSWVDLIGQLTMNTSGFSRISAPTFSDTAVVFNGSNTGLGVPNPLYNKSKSTFTIEIALKTQSSSAQYWVPFTTNGTGGSQNRIQVNMEGTPRVHSVRANYGVDTVNLGQNILTDKSGTISMIWDGSNLEVYFCGANKGAMTSYVSWITSGVSSVAKFQMGGDLTYRSSWFLGDIYSMRIYDVCLPSDGVLNNWNVDRLKYFT